MRNLSFYLSDILTYFNNLTVSSIESSSFMALDCDKAQAGDSSIVVGLNEIPYTGNDISEISVTEDGKAVSVTGYEVLPSSKKVKITLAEPVKSKCRYLVSFGSGFLNAFGNSVNQDENVVKFKAAEIASYEINGNELKVTIDNATDKALSPKVIVSTNCLKQLIGVRVFSCTEVQPGNTQEFTFDITGISENPNVYVWEDFINCQPLLTLN